jgi:general secretion pathway protein G
MTNQSLKREIHLKRHGPRGFTLLELMIVISIIFILLGMAAAQYVTAVRHAREATLGESLRAMREQIQYFTMDKKAAPQSLEDLVQAHYLREVPIDPITRAKDWVPVFEDVVLSPEQSGTGITDLRSNSHSVGSDGRPYSEW